MVADIVVEFGNARCQDTMDRFIGGQPAADADPRAVWRNTTQSPRQTWDAPVYEQFYRTVRAVNRALPVGRQIRVLLGDSPIDWPAGTWLGSVDAGLFFRVIAFGPNRAPVNPFLGCRSDRS